jgi:hypothetical protein
MTQQLLAASEIAQKKIRLVRMLFFPGLNVDDTPLRRSEFWELIKTLCGAVTLVTLGIAILSFSLQRKVLEQEYRWRHMKEAQDILREWDNRTGETKATIESYFRRRYGWSVMQPISREDAIAIRSALAGDADLWKMRKDIIALLNYFETISTAALRGIADEEILRDTLGQPMIAWRGHLREFTDLMDSDQKRQVWQPYYQVVERWSPQAPTLRPNASPTGIKPSHSWGSPERR